MGVLTLLAFTLLAYFGGEYIGLKPIVFGLLLGIIFSNLIPNLSQKWAPAIKFGEKKILGVAIILLGFGLSTERINDLTPNHFIGLVLMIPLLIFVGYFLSKAFKLSKNTGILVGIGHAICGNAAILAATPVIKAKSNETGISVAVINLLGTLSLVLVPLIAAVFDYSNFQSGFLAGGSIQAVGHAIAAGGNFGTEGSEIAAVIKLSRVALLGPALILLSLIQRSEKKAKLNLPWFVWGFVLTLIIRNLFNWDSAFLSIVHELESLFLIYAMVSLGMGIKFSDLKSQGLPSLILGGIVFFLQILFILGLINLA